MADSEEPKPNSRVPPSPPPMTRGVNESQPAPAAASTPVPAGGKVPVSKACPKCGGTKFSRVAPSTSVAFAKDRVCLDCNTRYSPPTPVWAAIVLIIFGGLMTLLFGLSCLPVALALLKSGTNANSSANPMGLICPLMLCILGVMALVHGDSGADDKKVRAESLRTR